MKQVKQIIVLLLSAILTLPLAGCGIGVDLTSSPAVSGPEGIVGDRNGDGIVKIACSTIAYTIATPFKVFIDDLDEFANKRGWTFDMLAAEGDALLQGEQINQLIGQNPDYMLILNGNAVLCNDYSKACADAGIPVLCLDADSAPQPDGSPDVNVSAYIGTNNYQMAYDLGMYIIDRYGADAELGIVRISLVPGMKAHEDRNRGFNDAITENSNYTLLGDTAWAYASRSEAQRYMEAFIGTYGDKIDILVGFDDDQTLGGVYALQEAGMTDVKVFSITGMKEGIQAVKDGKMELTVLRSWATMANKTIECIEKLFAGETIDYFQYIDTPYITKDNADQFEGEY